VGVSSVLPGRVQRQQDRWKLQVHTVYLAVNWRGGGGGHVGAGSVLLLDPDPDSIWSVDPYVDTDSESIRAKITHKNRKKLRNFFEVLDVRFRRLKSSSDAWTSLSFMEA